MALHWSVPYPRKLHCVFQRLALPLVLAGADEIVVTTERRRQWLMLRFKVRPDRVHVVPVFSNFPLARREYGHGKTVSDPPTGVTTIAVPGWASTPGLEDVFLKALSIPSLASREIMIELIGAPGPCSAAAKRWTSSARREGQTHRVKFRGVLSADDFSAHLRRADLVVLLFGDGPSTRHTMLAASLANGCVSIALDGPDTWEVLREYDAVEVVPPSARSIGPALASLLDDPLRRLWVSTQAMKVYDSYMSISRASEKFRKLIPE
jgi:glycosyltransferase involved in cell wall biosynthesis